MPFLKAKEIRQMSVEDKDKKLEELRTELSKLKATNNSGGAVDNPSRIREVRKAIARILTIQNEKAISVEE
jgi:large subunit ribosomal protein L29